MGRGPITQEAAAAKVSPRSLSRGNPEQMKAATAVADSDQVSDTEQLADQVAVGHSELEENRRLSGLIDRYPQIMEMPPREARQEIADAIVPKSDSPLDALRAAASNSNPDQAKEALRSSIAEYGAQSGELRQQRAEASKASIQESAADKKDKLQRDLMAALVREEPDFHRDLATLMHQADRGNEVAQTMIDMIRPNAMERDLAMAKGPGEQSVEQIGSRYADIADEAIALADSFIANDPQAEEASSDGSGGADRNGNAAASGAGDDGNPNSQQGGCSLCGENQLAGSVKRPNAAANSVTTLYLCKDCLDKWNENKKAQTSLSGGGYGGGYGGGGYGGGGFGRRGGGRSNNRNSGAAKRRQSHQPTEIEKWSEEFAHHLLG